MNEKTIAAAERALMDFLKKSRAEFDYFSGRLKKANILPAPDQQMVSSAIRKVNWYKAEIIDLEGELEILREELGMEENEEEEQGGEEKKNAKCDAGGA